jgi:uncharacterized protein (TIGR03435 family)
MILQFLALFLIVAVAGVFGQTGLFGPVTIRPRAGDLAPSLLFTKILSGAGSVRGDPPSLSGQMTVLAFFPNTSHNPEQVARWNELVEQFSGKPIQFVWITAENETSLLPKGWALLDADGATGRSFGMELPSAVIIGADGRIIGYDGSMVPSAETLTAALEDRIATVMPKGDIAELMAFAKSRKVLLGPEARRMPRPEENKPDFEPSYIVHIAPAKDEASMNASGPDYRSLRSFTLKDLIVELYDVAPVRIQLPASLDDGRRYEIALVLPERESKDQMYARFREGLQNYFHFTANREKRLLDAYVVTAPDRKPRAVEPKPQDDNLLVFSRSRSLEFQAVGSPHGSSSKIGLDAVRGIAMTGTLQEFCRIFEDQLDRPVVDETNLDGEFEFRVEASQTKDNDFLERLHEQSGLVIAPAQRTVEVLVIEPRQ